LAPMARAGLARAKIRSSKRDADTRHEATVSLCCGATLPRRQWSEVGDGDRPLGAPLAHDSELTGTEWTGQNQQRGMSFAPCPDLRVLSAHVSPRCRCRFGAFHSHRMAGLSATATESNGHTPWAQGHRCAGRACHQAHSERIGSLLFLFRCVSRGPTVPCPFRSGCVGYVSAGICDGGNPLAFVCCLPRPLCPSDLEQLDGSSGTHQRKQACIVSRAPARGLTAHLCCLPSLLSRCSLQKPARRGTRN
jgi:hypothetical protein